MIKADPQNIIILIDMTKMGIALQTQLHPMDTPATIINTIITCLVIVDVLAPLYQRKTSGNTANNNSTYSLLNFINSPWQMRDNIYLCV